MLSKNSYLSSQLETNLGVPQGSVLGLLLFCLYVNDLRNLLDGQTTNHIFYADDLQIYVHTTKEKILKGLTRLEEAAKQVTEWAGNSGLRLNAAKTKAIFFGSKKRVNRINEIGLPGVAMQDGVLILFSSEVVSLGVTLDSKMTWKPHIDKEAKKS